MNSLDQAYHAHRPTHTISQRGYVVVLHHGYGKSTRVRLREDMDVGMIFGYPLNTHTLSHTLRGTYPYPWILITCDRLHVWVVPVAWVWVATDEPMNL